jgi:hypothetical protein
LCNSAVKDISDTAHAKRQVILFTDVNHFLPKTGWDKVLLNKADVTIPDALLNKRMEPPAVNLLGKTGLKLRILKLGA